MNEEFFTGSPIKDVDIRLDDSAVYQKSDVMRILTDVLNQYDVSQKTYELAVSEQSKEMKALQMFLIGKRIAGASERTLQFYEMELNAWINFLGRGHS